MCFSKLIKCILHSCIYFDKYSQRFIKVQHSNPLRVPREAHCVILFRWHIIHENWVAFLNPIWKLIFLNSYLINDTCSCIVYWTNGSLSLWSFISICREANGMPRYAANSFGSENLEFVILICSGSPYFLLGSSCCLIYGPLSSTSPFSESMVSILQLLLTEVFSVPKFSIQRFWFLILPLGITLIHH